MYFTEFTCDLISAQPFLQCLCLHPLWLFCWSTFQTLTCSTAGEYVIDWKKEKKKNVTGTILFLCLWEPANVCVINTPAVTERDRVSVV